MSEQGFTRNRIARELNIAQGSVSNILKARKQEITDAEINKTSIGKIYFSPPPLSNSTDINTTSSPVLVAPNGATVETPQQESQTPETPESTILTDQPENAVKDLEDQIKTKRAELSQLDIDLAELDSEKSQLQKEIEENRTTLDADKKIVEDFATVKQEMTEVGIEPSHFCNVINAFKKYNYDCGKIMLAFADVQDILVEKKNIKEMKLEIDEQKKIIDEKLEQLGFGDFQKLRSSVASLMSLEQMGISQEKIIGICRNLHQNQISRQQWERGKNWDAGFINDSNGNKNETYNQWYGNGYQSYRF